MLDTVEGELCVVVLLIIILSEIYFLTLLAAPEPAKPSRSAKWRACITTSPTDSWKSGEQYDKNNPVCAHYDFQ